MKTTDSIVIPFIGRRLDSASAFAGATLFVFLVVTVSAADSADAAPAKSPAAIPWSQVSAKAGTEYRGDGLAVMPTAGGARLRCVFQRLEGDATREGLWLTSTFSNAVSDRFRVTAAEVGRVTPCAPGTANNTSNIQLENTGTVQVADKLVRFLRPGVIEEYTVSMDGVRQDFLIEQRPEGAGELAVRLAVSGARVEPAADGAQLVLENSGRKIAYSRLRVTDATGKEFPARMEVQMAPNVAAARQSAGVVEREDGGGLPTRRYAQFAVLVNDTDAVYPVRIDPTFSDANWISMGGIPGANGTVTAAVVDGAGNLYIGGTFTVAGEVLVNNIAKWNGSSWSALGSGVGGGGDIFNPPVVLALTVSGNDLYAGGRFTTAGGVSATNVAKWNGSSWSALGSGMSGSLYGGSSSVSALLVSGGDLYAGGYFTTAGGVSATNIAKWNGSSWSTLDSGLDNTVYALAVSGSDLYAGGSFTMAGTNSANYIAKWNGSSWSALGSGMNTDVRALAVSGSNVYAGGGFATAGGVGIGYAIAKWNGSSWTALGSGMDSVVNALAVSGSNLFAGGWFAKAGGVSVNHVAKWNGSSWSALGSGMDGAVNALAVSGSDLYAGGGFGGFTTAGGVSAKYIAKWNGSSWSTLGSGMSLGVSALAVSGTDLYAGGYFRMAGGVPANNIAKWNGSSWSALGSGVNNSVLALASSGSNLYAGGEFTTAGGVSAKYIAKWNGSSWSALSSGMNDRVHALAVSGSNLYAAGYFTAAGGVSANYIAKWNGNSWSALGSGMDACPLALVVSGSDLYAGGAFTAAGGVPVKYIAKWDGSSWSALGSGTGTSDGSPPYVYALAASGSNLYAAGLFTTAGGNPANYIAKWDGSSWSALGSGMSFYVLALAVSGSDLYAGGYFTAAGGVSANYIATWNGSNWSALGSGMNNPSYALAVSGNDLYAGGVFTTAGGKVSGSVARAVLGGAPGYNQLTGTSLSGGAMQFSYIGYPATNYALDRTFNLASPINWVGQESNTMTVSGVLMFTNTPAPGTNNFWRVRSVP